MIPTAQQIEDAKTELRWAREAAEKAQEAEEEAALALSRMEARLDAEATIKQERQERADCVRRWLDRERTKLPGLTNAEVQLVERLISDLETS